MTAARLSMRVIVRRSHMWLGLTIGALFACAGLTGSILVFYPEIDALLSKEMRSVRVGARPASWQAVIDALHRENPERSGAWRIEVTEGGGPIPVRYYRPAETEDKDFAPLLVWIDPDSMSTIRTAFWGETLMSFVYDLHYRLLLEKPGGVAMGSAGIIMLILLASGLWAWWPSAGGWWRALRFKHYAAPIRKLYDIHKLTALGGVALLLVVTATGVMLELPEQTRPMLAQVSTLYTAPKPVLSPKRSALSADRLIDLAQARFPDGELAWIETPATRTAPIRINFARPGEPSRRFPRTNVWLDPYTGETLAIRDGYSETGGDAVLNWLHPLHGGEAFGLAGRLLAFISGLLPTALLVTGLLRWRARRAR